MPLIDLRYPDWFAYVPWTDGTGRRWRGWRRLPLMTSFVMIYLVVAWLLFVPAAERRGQHYWIDQDAVGHLVFHIPELTADPYRTLRSTITAPWINHDSLQLVYVTILLLLFGVPFELREGTWRTVIVFFGTSVVAALVSGALLHLLYPQVWDSRFLERAWQWNWSGGSAGCFGLMGAVAARARGPSPLLACFVLWECFIWWIQLRNYTSAFHFTALTCGFLATRWLLPPVGRGHTANGAPSG